ncbi:MAG: FimV family protein [Gammaproteobacteria bacterium]|nr:FimV family protein [Gammaproteobacteria bacterium]
MLGAFASQAFAMGLGEIQLLSALNQPLHAEIELLSPTAADLDDLRATLASSEAYAKAGVERAFFHTKMRFAVVKRPDGSAAIKITSHDPVREPYLDFLLEATWGSGQVLREYTVLVDPPVMMPAPAPVVEAPAMEAPAPAADMDDSAPAYSGGGGSGLADGEYRVGNHDTTWRVATAVRPDGSVSMEQVMISLLRANPHAFAQQNINKLKAGQILRVPSREEMAAIGHADALAEVRAQKNQWQGSAAVAAEPAQPAVAAEAPAAAPAPAPASAPTPTPAAPTQAPAADAQLKLVAPKTDETDASKATGAAQTGGQTADQNVGDMRKELTLAVEAVEAQRQENQELNTRLKQLEDQITQLHRLIELKNTEMSQLSGSAAPTAEGEAVPPTTAPADNTAETNQPATPAPEQTVSPEAETALQPGVATPEAAAPTTPATETASAPQQSTDQPKDEGLLAALLANPLVKWGVAGGAVIVGLLAWMGARRRRMEDTDFQESILAERHPGGAKVAAAAAPVSATVATPEAPADTTAKEEAHSDSSLFTDFAVSDMGAIQNDAEADPIAEADVYLAYGRYQQAEELIRNALNRAPQRNELRFKLLEVLFAAKNTNAFDTEAEALLVSLGGQDDELWQRVAEMGQELNPGNPLYRPGGMPATADQGLDFDLGGTTQGGGGAGESYDATPAAAAHDDNSLDFDLGELASFAPQTQEAAPSLPIDDDFSFDLSAGDDLEDAGEGVLASADEVSTKLDLARAYIEMGDPDGARSILHEVLEEGSATQKSEAQTLLSQMG